MKIKIVFILTLLLFFIGCKTHKPIKEIPVRTVEKVKTKIIPIKVPADSTLLTALLECDSANNVILRELAEKKTKGVKSNFSLKKGKLKYHTKTNIRDTIVVVKDSISTQQIPYKVEVPKVEYRQTGLQNFLSWAGGLALVYILIRIIIKAIKKKLNINLKLIKRWKKEY